MKVWILTLVLIFSVSALAAEEQEISMTKATTYAIGSAAIGAHIGVKLDNKKLGKKIVRKISRGGLIIGALSFAFGVSEAKLLDDTKASSENIASVKGQTATNTQAER